jgi:hemolysin activation/secretion protein
MYTPTHKSHFIAVAIALAEVLCLGVRAWVALAAVLFISVSQAATFDAGSLQKQIEQGLPSKPAPSVTRPRETAPTEMVKPGEVTVVVTQFLFTGNTLLTTAQLNEVTKPFLNRALNFAQLQQVADVITTAYRESGWTVRAYLPKQEIDKGQVTIQIVEAVFGNANLVGPLSQRIEAKQLIDVVQANQAKGKPVQSQAIDRALLLLSDLPGIHVVGNLVEGTQEGETDLLLSVTDKELLSTNAAWDNNGSRATGAQRLSLNAYLNSPARIGDSFVANLMHTQGSDYIRGTYSLPAGSDGWRTGFHTSHLSYEILASYDPTASGTHGTATTYGLDASYPLIRSQMRNLNFNTSYDYKKFENYASNILSSNYSANISVLGLSDNIIDNWGGGGTINNSLMLTQGSINRDGSADSQSDKDGANVAGYFRKLSASISRLQTLNNDLSFYALVTAQASNRNLDSSERMYLGGSSGVRAYPSSEAGGAAGQILTFELRQRLGVGLLLTGFYDYGHISVYKNNQNVSNGTAITTTNSYDLKGFGLSLGWQGPQGADIKATLAHRIADNPAANALTGLDGDKTKSLTRLWVNVNISF